MLQFFLNCFCKSYKISPIEDESVVDTPSLSQPLLIHGIPVMKYWFWSAKVGSFYNLKEALPKVANINETDEDGNTALHLAAKHNHIKAIEFLLESNCNPNICNRLNKKPKELLKTKADKDTIIVGNDPMKLISAQYSLPDCFTDWDISNGVKAKELLESYEVKFTGDTLEIIEL